MQRNHRFPCARATLNDQYSALRGANDLVLLGLNGCHDVAKLPGAAASERGQQGAVATQPSCGLLHTGERLATQPLVMPHAQVAGAKQFVFNAKQLLPLNGKVSAARKAHWLTTCCSIKRLGNWGSPVDNDGFARNIGNSQTSDMKAFDLVCVINLAIDSTKDKCGIAQIQMGEALQQLLVK
jgi:hypothetical protein